VTLPIRDFSEHSCVFRADRSMKVLHNQWVMNTHPALLGSKSVSTGVALRQRVQQRLGLLQVRRVKALGKPAVDRSQQLTGLDALAVALP
jgi:hypothetical protein